jgi:DNA-directed RNA polymerase beta subunit
MSGSRRSSLSIRSQPVTLLDEIDEWERGTLILVKQTADRARQRVNELMMSHNLASGKDSNEFRRRNSVDSSFDELNFKLKNLQTALNTYSPRIRLDITPIDWSTILRVFLETSTISNYDVLSNRQLFFGGTLLTQEDQIQLNKFYGNDTQKWNLIYKGTRDGFTIDDFHRCCDSQGPTMTIIESLDNYLFGGYTSISWNFHQGAKSGVMDRTAFLFTLTNPHGISSTKYPVKSSGEHAVVPNAMGPTFGQYDICIYPNSNLNSQSFVKFPTHYNDSTGKGYLTFTGSTNFTTTDIEIYRLANIWDQQF